MMHLYGALILFVTVSAACGLSCYNCIGKGCTDKITCPSGFDRCATVTVKDFVTKSCMISNLCVDLIKCCSTDLCNSAIPTGSSVLLLLASSAIITVFL
ncbi:lymphocyte antigen 6G-like [Pseudoliparis swirei]|uniref:lymphocyte antigen 6G-like n=1 Tax=Pseudoliparis swirei TaxID=2059687 RepID=UPI0024BD6472|nr:lymphocyte antigen 6G-like [Pseudoliparis swirei]